MQASVCVLKAPVPPPPLPLQPLPPLPVTVPQQALDLDLAQVQLKDLLQERATALDQAQAVQSSFFVWWCKFFNGTSQQCPHYNNLQNEKYNQINALNNGIHNVDCIS